MKTQISPYFSLGCQTEVKKNSQIKNIVKKTTFFATVRSLEKSTQRDILKKKNVYFGRKVDQTLLYMIAWK